MSCRAFLATPVPLELIRSMLETAKQAPSGGNLQPWQVHVLTGAPLQDFLGLVRQKLRDLPHGEGTEYPVYPPNLKEPYRSRRFKCGEDLYATICVPREDKPRRLAQFARNYELFGAPALLFFAIDRQMGVDQWADVGMFMQNIMLLAREHGLHTCAQESWASWHRTVAEFIGLSSELMLFCGVALGFRDDAAPINRLRTDRASLEEFATFHTS
jgi:nitroreductase